MEEISESDEIIPTQTTHSVSMMLDVDHRGRQLFLQGCSTVASQLPPILCVHEFGLSSAVMADFIQAMVARNISCYAFDTRGHGKSAANDQGFYGSQKILTKDLLQVAAWVRHRENGNAPIILGQGLAVGPALMLQYRQFKFCRGVIMLQPPLQLHSTPSRWMSYFISLLVDIYPKWMIRGRNSLLKDLLDVGPEAYASALQNRISVHMADDLEFSQRRLDRLCGKVRVPSLVLYGSHNQLVDLERCLEIVRDWRKAGTVETMTIDEMTGAIPTKQSGAKILDRLADAVATWTRAHFSNDIEGQENATS